MCQLFQSKDCTAKWFNLILNPVFYNAISLHFHSLVIFSPFSFTDSQAANRRFHPRYVTPLNINNKTLVLSEARVLKLSDVLANLNVNGTEYPDIFGVPFLL